MNSHAKLENTYWHEATHWLSANNPQLFKQITDAVELTDEQAREYIKISNRNDLTIEDAKEEIIADNMIDSAKRMGLLNQIGIKDKPLVERMVSWLKSMMDRFIDFFNGKKIMTEQQKKLLNDTFRAIAGEVKDASGKKVFDYDVEKGVENLLSKYALGYFVVDTTYWNHFYFYPGK